MAPLYSRILRDAAEHPLTLTARKLLKLGFSGFGTPTKKWILQDLGKSSYGSTVTMAVLEEEEPSGVESNTDGMNKIDFELSDSHTLSTSFSIKWPA